MALSNSALTPDEAVTTFQNPEDLILSGKFMLDKQHQGTALQYAAEKNLRDTGELYNHIVLTAYEHYKSPTKIHAFIKLVNTSNTIGQAVLSDKVSLDAIKLMVEEGQADITLPYNVYDSQKG